MAQVARHDPEALGATLAGIGALPGLEPFAARESVRFAA